MRFRVSGRDAAEDMVRGVEADIARFTTASIRENAEEFKQDWRDQIEDAGLGPKLARTVRAQVYPQGQDSVDAAALIWTKAPKIIDAFATGATIRPVGGARYLWIPTGETPKKRQGQALTPREVEARFGRKLVIVNPAHWRMRTTTTAFGKAEAFAGFDGLTVRRSSGRWRNASRNQMTKGHRSYRETTRQFVVMFTLVRSVRMDKKLDLEALARAAEARQAELLSKHWR